MKKNKKDQEKRGIISVVQSPDEVENKKELLNEFAQVGSRLESLKQKLNYSLPIFQISIC